jgi:ribosomal protein L17
MLSPSFLRVQAEKCLRSALITTDRFAAAELRKMAFDLKTWAHEADVEIQRTRTAGE